MIRIIGGMLFGIFFVAPALSIPFSNLDSSGIGRALSGLGSEIWAYGIEAIKGVI